MDWYLMVLKKYAVFQGRAQRKEYWYFVFINIAIVLGLLCFDFIIFQIVPGQQHGILTTIYYLAIIVPTIAVQVRRLHDTGRTGWWILLTAIPLIGPIVLLVFYCQDSESGTNVYGANPK